MPGVADESRRHARTSGESDPLIGDALQTVLDRGDFSPPLPDEAPAGRRRGGAPAPIEADPAHRRRADRAQPRRPSPPCEREIADDVRAGAVRLHPGATSQELKRVLFDPRSLQVIMAGMEATWWLNDHLEAWLGEKNAADTLTQSVPHNVTSEMGLALLDVADVIRPHPEVVAFLQQVECGATTTASSTSSPRSRAAARRATPSGPSSTSTACAAPARSTSRRPRWSERPATLVPTILGNVKNFEPGAGKRRFEQGRQEARREGAGTAGTPAGPARRAAEGRRDQADDRPRPHLRRVPGVPQVRHGQPLLRVQAGPAAGGRAPRAGRRRCASSTTSSSSGSTSSTRSCARNRVDDRLIRERREEFRSYRGAHAASGAHLGRRGHHRRVPARRPPARRARRAGGLRRAPSRAGPA